MAVLSKLNPKRVFEYFEDICSIPHGSRNTSAISDYCVEFAKAHSLKYTQDENNNIIIVKEASKGYEDSQGVIIQGHLDMVCEKSLDTDIDMQTQGLKLCIDGDFIHADGTTLGGDDGIAVAYALAVLEDDTLRHPRIEAVFTVDEEIGMLGAADIDLSGIQSRMLLNIDSEDEGIFLASCAGGRTAVCTLPVEREEVRGSVINIMLDGLIGGHSGGEIDKGRGNSNVLMARMLAHLEKSCQFRIIKLEGGLKDNAIPFATSAQILTDDSKRFIRKCREYAAVICTEYSKTDSEMKFLCKTEDDDSFRSALDERSTHKVLCLLLNLPNGIQSMSADIPGLVETSLNLGILKLDTSELAASFAVRSSVTSAKLALYERLESLVQYMGGEVDFFGDYPAWEYKKDSRLRDVMVTAYKELYEKEPKIEAIHAGLECGIFSGKLEGLDCISFGPQMYDIHTIREKLSISSVERTWRLLCLTLEKLK